VKPAAPPRGHPFLVPLLVVYALTALAAPLGHVLEVREGPALASAAQVASGSIPVDHHGDPLHEDVDCLTCLLLTVAGTEPVSLDAVGPFARAIAAAAAAPEPVRLARTFSLPPSRGPPTA
jgi:hypothetical protein